MRDSLNQVFIMPESPLLDLVPLKLHNLQTNRKVMSITVKHGIIADFMGFIILQQLR